MEKDGKSKQYNEIITTSTSVITQIDTLERWNSINKGFF